MSDTNKSTDEKDPEADKNVICRLYGQSRLNSLTHTQKAMRPLFGMSPQKYPKRSLIG
jgi:hypothetical protein